MANGVKTIWSPTRTARQWSREGFVVLPVREYQRLLQYADVDMTRHRRFSTVPKHPEITARLDEALADVRSGRVYGPFRSAQAMIRSLRGRRRA
jgi:hypothetical protein